MINVSSSVKTDCNSDNLKYKEYILVDGQTVEIRGKMSNSCYNDGNIFGTFIMKKLEFTTENNIDYKGKEVVYYKSINGESFKIGTYIVTEIKDNDSDETVTVTSLDYGLKTAIPYTTELDYTSGTVTLFDVLIEACTNAGLNLANGSITNGDFIVDSNQFTDNQLIGDVIKAIAHISGDFATVNENDEIELVYEEETEEIIEDYTELADKRDTLPITSVSIGTSQVSGQEAILRDEDMIAEYGEHWLVLNDNPFAYTLEKRQELVTAIFNKIKGFSYSSFESSYSFKPYLQLGDKIQFRNKAGELINSRVLKIDTDYDDITLSAPSIIDATVNYKQPEDVKSLIKKLQVLVDQSNGLISLINQQITELTDYIKTKTDTNTILELTNTTESTGAINTLSIKGFELKPLYCSPYTFCSNTTYCGVQTIYPIMFASENTFVEPTIVYVASPISLQKLGSVYDEINISENKIFVIQRLGYEDDELTVLDTPITHDLGTVQLPTFDTTTYLKVYDFADLIWSCEYIEKNDITNVFTTKIETSAIQTITNENINLRVEKNKIIAEINLSSEEATINASRINLTATDIINLIAGNELNLTSKNITIASDKFNVDAYGNLECESATVNSATINGSAIVNGDKFSVDSDGNMTCNGATLTGGTITSQKFKVDAEGNIEATGGDIGGFELSEDKFETNIYSDYTFTETDIDKLIDYMMGTGTLTNAEKELYDLNKDGVLNSMDLFLMQRYVIVGITPQNPGTFSINTKDIFNTMVFKNGSGDIMVNINMFLSYLSRIQSDTIYGTTITADYLYAKNLQSGSILITPSAPNTPTGVAITFPQEFSSIPQVITGAITSIPGTGVLGTSASNITTTGCTLYLTRTNTGTTTVMWMAYEYI